MLTPHSIAARHPSPFDRIKLRPSPLPHCRHLHHHNPHKDHHRHHPHNAVKALTTTPRRPQQQLPPPPHTRPNLFPHVPIPCLKVHNDCHDHPRTRWAMTATNHSGAVTALSNHVPCVSANFPPFAAATTAGCVGMSTVIIVATNIAELLITYHRWAVW